MQPPAYYRPTILGIPSLAALAVVACVLLALTEYAARVLEPLDYQGPLVEFKNLTTAIVEAKLISTSSVTTV